MRILSIADDFSGAAEIAGIGLRYGLPTRLLRKGPAHLAEGLTVIDTDSRLISRDSAARAVSEAIAGLDLQSGDLIYKKTDSVFRGALRDEIETLMDKLGFPAALLAPQNPSRGRTIRDGIYQIKGVSLDQTNFANDPDHPARSSKVLKLLAESGARSIHYAEPEELLLRDGIMICGAWDSETLSRWADRVSDAVLPAGSSDFFAAILESRGLAVSRPLLSRLDGSRRLFVCGSASSYSRELNSQALQRGVRVLAMPDEVFTGGNVSHWATDVSATVTAYSSALVVITQPLDRASSASTRLQDALGDLVARVLEISPLDHLFLEGGATASAICRRMNWYDFEVRGELATGVVQLHVDSPRVQSLLVKPGSYAWPDCVWTDR